MACQSFLKIRSLDVRFFRFFFRSFNCFLKSKTKTLKTTKTKFQTSFLFLFECSFPNSANVNAGSIGAIFPHDGQRRPVWPGNEALSSGSRACSIDHQIQRHWNTGYDFGFCFCFCFFRFHILLFSSFWFVFDVLLVSIRDLICLFIFMFAFAFAFSSFCFFGFSFFFCFFRYFFVFLLK